MTTTKHMSFYLTQRLTRDNNPSRKGFDRFFGCDYMGSSEFEWGAIPDSLKRLRASGDIQSHTGQVTRGDITVPVYVVGAASDIAAVPDGLTEWLRERRPAGKEMSYFPEAIEGTTSDYQARVVAWWSLSDDVLWTLDSNIATDLLAAVQG